MLHTKTWMDLENIMLNETNQTQSHIVYDSSYTEVPRIGKFIEAESRIEVARGWGQGERGVTV